MIEHIFYGDSFSMEDCLTSKAEQICNDGDGANIMKKFSKKLMMPRKNTNNAVPI